MSDELFCNDDNQNELNQYNEPVEEENVPFKFRRHGFKWRPNEIEQLWREFEMKEYTIPEIAYIHERSCSAIICRLKAEGLITINYPFTDSTMTTFMDNYAEYMYRSCSQDELESYSEDDEDSEDDDEDLEVGEVVKFVNYSPDHMDKYLFAYFNTLSTTAGYIGSAIRLVGSAVKFFIGR
jgi:hypothetical protein